MSEIITLDGPAGVGKSTLTALLAEELHLPFLDTGAMFRILALKLGEEALDMPAEKLLAQNIKFTLAGAGSGTTLYYDEVPAPPEIRTEEIGSLASRLATRPEIRALLLKAQQDLGKKHALVAEGRDMGTVVFPQARHKFFLDADPEIRARRRWKELLAKGQDCSLADIQEKISRRDWQDRNRPVAPLRPAPDAEIIDTGNLTIDGVLKRILATIRQKT